MKIIPNNKLGTTGIYILLVLSIVLIVVSAFITYYNTLEKNRSTETIIRRYRSIVSSTRLLSLLQDMETGQRGYIITGDSDFLEPYSNAKFLLAAETDSLAKLISDNEEQINFLSEKIIVSIDNKSKDLEKTISIVNSFGTDSAARSVNAKIGKAHMDTLRILVDDLVVRERAFLSEQNRRLEANTKMEDYIRFFSFGLVGLTSLLALLAIFRRQKSIRELIRSLNKANEELEMKVAERTKQLLDANTAKDHFLGIASHDLKVPIAGVLRIIELMKLDTDARSAAEMEYLNTMEESCSNMQQLIADLLDISRIERGEIIREAEEVNLPVFVAKILKDFSHQGEKKKIQVLQVGAVEGNITTDPDILKRILDNLLSNAIKFSGSHTVVQLHVQRADGSIVFKIVDQGPGIPPGEIPLLFEKFQRLTNRPTGGEDSTGLGLFIVRELITKLSGKMAVTSKVGVGSTFTVSIPI